MSVTVDNLTTLKNIAGEDKFNGFALIVINKRAWYVYDIASVETPDDDNVVMPLDGQGRWFKCNNGINTQNSVIASIATLATTTLDFSNNENLVLTLNTSTIINFSTTLRNGYFNLHLVRSSSSVNITGWDARLKWKTTAYNFSASNITKAVLSFLVYNNVIYNISTNEYI